MSPVSGTSVGRVIRLTCTGQTTLCDEDFGCHLVEVVDLGRKPT